MKTELAVVIALVVGCGPSPDARYAATQAQADALTTAGRHAEAAARWLDAARGAGAESDREEATYRAAGSYERAGRPGDALALYERLARGKGDRAARASYDRARLVRESDPGKGSELLLRAVKDHPDSGLAPRALRELLEEREARGGTAAALDACTGLLVELAGSELDETLRYERARILERLGRLAPARDGYLDAASRHPYPDGALWDDALFRAAGCEERLDHPLAAIALLERLLTERESSSGLGSYERSRYDEARFHVAELYRDGLHDPERARREFRRVYTEHVTSRFRDDALWQEALVGRASGDPAGTCAPLALLVRDFPDSRYAPCATRLCGSVRAVGGRGCHVELAEPAAAPEPPGEAHSSSSSSSSSSP